MSRFMDFKRLFPYPIATLTVYWNSIFLGASAILLTLNAEYLAERWGTADVADIFFIIGAIGVGKCLGEIGSGLFSDKFGRKLTLLIGCVTYALYMLIIVFINNIETAFALTIIAGIGHSFIDNATYPTLTESVPAAPESATIALKIFISMGSILVPAVLAFIVRHDLDRGLIFIFFFAFVSLSIVGTLLAKFPQPNLVVSKKGVIVDEKELFKEKPKVYPEGIACIIMGATAFSTFYIAQQSLKTIGIKLGMSDIDASYLLSIYSTGAICAVICLIFLLNSYLKPVTILLIFPACSIVSYLMLYFVPLPEIALIFAFAIGFFSAGGIFQLTIATIIELFPKRKGFYGSLVSFASSFSIFLVANIVGRYAKTDVMQLLLIGGIIAGVSVFCAVVLNYRYRKVIKF